MKKNIVKFEGYKVQKFNLEKVDNVPKNEQNNLTINCNAFKNEEKGKENMYKVSMHIELFTNLSKIELILEGIFIIEKELEEENKQYFLGVSAPAILYPYARTFISNVTAFDTGEAVILPILNFADKLQD